MDFMKINTSSPKQTPMEVIEPKLRNKIHYGDLWVMMHTAAIFLPEKLDKTQESHIKNYIEGIVTFGNITPNSKLKKLYSDYKIMNNNQDFSTRENASVWLCNFHNYVNLLNDKDLFECKIENIARRWGNSNVIVNKRSGSYL